MCTTFGGHGPRKNLGKQKRPKFGANFGQFSNFNTYISRVGLDIGKGKQT